MSKFWIGMVLMFSMVNCTLNTKLSPVNLTSFLNDNSSKIWVIDQKWKESANVAPSELNQKFALVFYVSGNVILQQISELGTSNCLRGTYTMDSEKKKIELDFGQEHWSFKVKVNSINSMIWLPLKTSQLKYKMKIIPFPAY
jgi:hypothetical protein